MSAPMRLVVLGLSLSSSWGNGHAVTFRALLKAFAARGHDVLFLERRVPWYAAHQDLADPAYCRIAFYDELSGLEAFRAEVEGADAVLVGSYVPEGAAAGRWVRDAARGVVAFYDIDTPVTLAKLARGDEDYLAASQIPGYDVYFSFTGGPTLKRLGEAYGSPAPRALFCSADPELYRPKDVAPRWDLSYLGTYSADRQPPLERLLIEPARRLPRCRFVVAGPQYPADIAWPANVERIDHLPPAAHPDFYAASRFTLNITRADMVAAGFSPSIRLFEAASCATPVISDIWDGLETLFAPGREIVLAGNADDVVAALALSHGQRQAMGQAARRRVAAEHAPAHRAAVLEHELRAAAALKSSSAAPRVKGVPVMEIAKPRLRVLVAGGAGFLGSHLCDRLLEGGHEVVCLDNLQTGSMANLAKAQGLPGFEFVRADIVEPLPEKIARRRFDRIYNLACAASPLHYQAAPEHTLLTSVLGTVHLLRLAESCGARLLFTSTSEVYGDPEIHPQPETYRGNVNPIGPRACYDEGKRAAETLCFDFERSGRGSVRVARIFNTYGPRLSPADGRVVSNMIRQALDNEPITIFGDGSQTRSFCYVDDLIAGLTALMEHDGPQPGPVNLGNPAELSISDLAEAIPALTGTSQPVTYLPLPVDDPRRRQPMIERARKVLGWAPRMPLEEGLRQTVAWFRAEKERGGVQLANVR